MIRTACFDDWNWSNVIWTGDLCFQQTGRASAMALVTLLAFTDSSVIGTIETIVASGMLVSNVIIGIFSMKKDT